MLIVIWAYKWWVLYITIYHILILRSPVSLLFPVMYSVPILCFRRWCIFCIGRYCFISGISHHIVLRTSLCFATCFRCHFCSIFYFDLFLSWCSILFTLPKRYKHLKPQPTNTTCDVTRTLTRPFGVHFEQQAQPAGSGTLGSIGASKWPGSWWEFGSSVAQVLYRETHEWNWARALI